MPSLLAFHPQYLPPYILHSQLTHLNHLVHILRTTAADPGDLALSSVSHPTQTANTSTSTNTNPHLNPTPPPTPTTPTTPTTLTTLTTPTTPNRNPPSAPGFFTCALLLGCTPHDTEVITSRLACAPAAAHAHPLFLAGVVAELERTRHDGLVRDRVFHLLQRVKALAALGGTSASSFSSSSSGAAASSSSSPSAAGKVKGVGAVGVGEMYSVNLWIEVWQLRTALWAWGEELRKMEGVLELGGEGMGNGMEMGARIRKRLGEIRAEYEVYVRQCSMVIEGMALSAQLVSPLFMVV